MHAVCSGSCDRRYVFWVSLHHVFVRRSWPSHGSAAIDSSTSFCHPTSVCRCWPWGPPPGVQGRTPAVALRAGWVASGHWLMRISLRLMSVHRCWPCGAPPGVQEQIPAAALRAG
eukprot:1160912-Pelagomonas_calceolata.AAC.10